MIQTRHAPAAARDLRLLQLGDFWAYEVSGQLAPPGSDVLLALSGSIVITVVPDTLVDHPGSVMLTFVQELQAKWSDGLLEPFPAPELVWGLRCQAFSDLLNFGEVG